MENTDLYTLSLSTIDTAGNGNYGFNKAVIGLQTITGINDNWWAAQFIRSLHRGPRGILAFANVAGTQDEMLALAEKVKLASDSHLIADVKFMPRVRIWPPQVSPEGE